MIYLISVSFHDKVYRKVRGDDGGFIASDWSVNTQSGMLRTASFLETLTCIL